MIKTHLTKKKENPSSWVFLKLLQQGYQQLTFRNAYTVKIIIYLYNTFHLNTLLYDNFNGYLSEFKSLNLRFDNISGFCPCHKFGIDLWVFICLHFQRLSCFLWSPPVLAHPPTHIPLLRKFSVFREWIFVYSLLYAWAL